jgi:integrase
MIQDQLIAILIASRLELIYAAAMTRRGWGDDGIYWVESRKRYAGAISLGWGADGKRARKVVYGRTKQEVKDKLKEAHEDAAAAVKTSRDYTLLHAVNDWLADGMDNPSDGTVAKYANVLKPILEVLGPRPLAELTAKQVRAALIRFATTHATDTVGIARLGLERAIRHAQANGRIRTNVVELITTPKGTDGRPSKSLTLDQAHAVLEASRRPVAVAEFPGLPPRPPALMNAYISLSLLVGVRTEEARALRWDHLNLTGNPEATPPVPPSVSVWRSVRAHGDTKTEKSRRTLALPLLAVAALEAQLAAQDQDRANAGELWQEHGLVFTTKLGTGLDAGNVRRMFKNVCKAAGIGTDWTPREMRTSFVSLMSYHGLSTEEISHLVGHSSTKVTESIYRLELRPVIKSGAELMDKVFNA